jgi:hypothetical protein
MAMRMPGASQGRHQDVPLKSFILCLPYEPENDATPHLK